MRDNGDLYEYIAVYVDDLSIVSRDAAAIINTLEPEPINFKLKGTGPLLLHLGCDYFHDGDGTLCYGPLKYIDRMVTAYKRMFRNRAQNAARPSKRETTQNLMIPSYLMKMVSPNTNR